MNGGDQNFGAMPAQPVPISSFPAEKSNKKTPAIILGVILLAAICIVAFLSFFKNDSRTAQGNLRTTSEYANYAINGDQNLSDIGDNYDHSARAYYFKEAFSATSKEWSPVYENLNNFLLTMSEKGDDDFKTLVKDQLATLTMFNVYRELEKYDSQQLIYEYIEGNFVQTERDIRAKLQTLDRTANVYVETYINSMSSFLELSEKIVEAYYADGCKGETVDELGACELSEDAETEIIKLSNSLRSAYDEKEYAIESGIHYYLKMVYETAKYDLGVTSE